MQFDIHDVGDNALPPCDHAAELERLREESAENKRHWIEATRYIGESETEIQKSPGYNVEVSLPDNIARLHRIEEAARAVVNTYEANPYVADEHLNKTEALRAALGEK